MKKAEALLLIEQAPEVIKIIGQRSFPSDSHGRVKGYDISVMVEERTGVASNTTMTFYVVDEGLPEETAYWKAGREPSTQKPTPSLSFKEKLKNFYEQIRQGDPNVIGVQSKDSDINEDGQYAEVTIVFKDPSWDGTMPMPETIKVKFDVGEDAQGNIWYAAQDRALMDAHNL